jgi:hypothetical protein
MKFLTTVLGEELLKNGQNEKWTFQNRDKYRNLPTEQCLHILPAIQISPLWFSRVWVPQEGTLAMLSLMPKSNVLDAIGLSLWGR